MGCVFILVRHLLPVCEKKNLNFPYTMVIYRILSHFFFSYHNRKFPIYFTKLPLEMMYWGLSFCTCMTSTSCLPPKKSLYNDNIKKVFVIFFSATVTINHFS